MILATLNPLADGSCEVIPVRGAQFCHNQKTGCEHTVDRSVEQPVSLLMAVLGVPEQPSKKGQYRLLRIERCDKADSGDQAGVSGEMSPVYQIVFCSEPLGAKVADTSKETQQ
ncbi:MAG: hypothetical protein ACK4UN_15540 [Limisphaerales bacterium]